MTNKISLFRAKCKCCGKHFEHPSVGDFAYGEYVLYTTDGKHQVLASAFGEFAEKVGALFSSSVAGSFCAALAKLADPVQGTQLTPNIHCPHCASTELEYWEGERVGFTALPEATFLKASLLSDAEIIKIISEPCGNA